MVRPSVELNMSVSSSCIGCGLEVLRALRSGSVSCGDKRCENRLLIALIMALSPENGPQTHFRYDELSVTRTIGVLFKNAPSLERSFF